jgi:predicted nucleic acid-binding protein
LIAIDSSVIVAALAKWHSDHGRAQRALERALEGRDGVVIPGHALVESFSVLTRMPAPYRAGARDVLQALRQTFEASRVVALNARSIWPVLERVVSLGLSGGIVYDALILESAADAGATQLLTLNARDYDRLEPRLHVVGV